MESSFCRHFLLLLHLVKWTHFDWSAAISPHRIANQCIKRISFSLSTYRGNFCISFVSCLEELDEDKSLWLHSISYQPFSLTFQVLNHRFSYCMYLLCYLSNALNSKNMLISGMSLVHPTSFHQLKESSHYYVYGEYMSKTLPKHVFLRFWEIQELLRIVMVLRNV